MARRQARPVDYDESLAVDIALTYAESPKSLVRLIEEHPHWPSARTIAKWERDYRMFASEMNLSRAVRADVLVDTAIDELSGLDPSGARGEANAKVSKARALVEMRMRQAKRLSPVWHEKTTHVVAGDAANPVRSVDLSQLSVEQLREMRALANVAKARPDGDGSTPAISGTSERPRPDTLDS